MDGDVIMGIVVIVIGLLLMLVEVAIIPGFGLVGLLGLGCMGGGVYYLWTAAGVVAGVAGIVVSVGLSGVFLIWFIRSKTASKLLVLDDAIKGTSTASEELDVLVGAVAVATSALRPSGVIEVGDERYDAIVADGTFAAAHARLRIVGHEHGQLVVEAVEEDGDGPAA